MRVLGGPLQDGSPTKEVQTQPGWDRGQGWLLSESNILGEALGTPEIYTRQSKKRTDRGNSLCKSLEEREENVLEINIG